MGQLAAPLAIATKVMGVANTMGNMNHENKMIGLQHEQQKQAYERQQRDLKEKKKRDMATMRARKGAGGQASSGSAQAILRGLSKSYATGASDMAKDNHLLYRRNLLESRKKTRENISTRLEQAGKIGNIFGNGF